MKIFIFTLIFFITVKTSFSETIKIVELNTWGVPVAAWDTFRYQEAMKAMEKLDPDFIVLTEVFSKKGKHAFLSEKYPYVADGGGRIPRVVGSGLRILSKYPLEMHAVLTFRACQKDDCLSRKGATLITAKLPSGKEINLTATHLNARGGDVPRIDQLKQLKLFNEYYEKSGVPTLVVGDFNFNPSSEAYDYLIKNLDLSDAWNETHSSSELGYTYNAFENHYAHDYSIKTKFPLVKERIDFFFHRGNIKPISTEIIFNHDQELYTDHYGLLAKFEI